MAATWMLIEAIGEGVKKIEKISPDFLIEKEHKDDAIFDIRTEEHKNRKFPRIERIFQNHRFSYKIFKV